MSPVEGPLKVAVVAACAYPVPQGSQVYIRETSRALHRAGAEVHLVCYGYGVGEADEPFPVYRAANPLGAGKTSAGPSWHKPVLDALLVRRLRRVIRDEAIDVVDAHNYEGLLAALGTGFRPIVYHPHNAMADELPFYTRWRDPARRFGGMLDRALPGRADLVIAPHRRLAEYLVERGCAQSRVRVVCPAMPAPTRVAHPKANARPAIVYAGNLDAYQNLDLFRRAAAVVRGHEDSARFVIATHAADGIDWAECVHVDDHASLMNLLAGDVIVVCPRTSWSGYPIKLLNAMEAGAAIVCCESAAHPLTDGVDGVVIADDDPEAMADAIRTLIADPVRRAQLGTTARRSLETNHDPSTVGATHVAFYRELTASVRRPIRVL